MTDEANITESTDAPADPHSIESPEDVAREAGFLPDAPTEEPTPEPEPKPVRYAEAREAVEAVGADQDELDEFLGNNEDLEEHLRALPGWTAQPETDAEVAANASILNNLIRGAEESRDEREDILVQAIEAYEDGASGAEVTAALDQIDPSLSLRFARHWQRDESEPLTADEYLSGRQKLENLLQIAEEESAGLEQAQEEAAQIDAGARKGYERFVAELSPVEKKAYEPYMARILEEAFTDTETDIDYPWHDPTATDLLLRAVLGQAKQYYQADVSARVKAEDDALDRQAANEAGFLGGTDHRKSFEEHYADELAARARDGRLKPLPVPTRAERREATLASLDLDPRIEAGWKNFLPTPKHEPDPVKEVDLLFGSDEEIRQQGWNLGPASHTPRPKKRGRRGSLRISRR
jgi:hypothetical protein